MPRINAERLIADMHRLREFGSAKERGFEHPTEDQSSRHVDGGLLPAPTAFGVVRPTFTDADMAARRWLKAKFEEAGLIASIDGVANVIGRSANQGPALLVGSHSDTQPRGGWLDGALGVIYGLECARALAEDPATAHFAVDCASWADEETVYLNMLGSRSFIGALSKLDSSLEAEIAAASALPAGVTDSTGEYIIPPSEPLAAAIARVGLSDEPRVSLAGDEDRYLGFFEAHIEQGPFLEANGNSIGVVSACVGIFGGDIFFYGQQNHAGTTPMDLRKDAGMGSIVFGGWVHEAFKTVFAPSPSAVWTFGDVEFGTHSHSTVPGYARLRLQWRDASLELMQEAKRTVLELIDQMNARSDEFRLRVTTSLRPEDGESGGYLHDMVPALMDEEMMAHCKAAAEEHASGKWTVMPSGAGHDAQRIAEVMPSAMLFVPSINGLSHNFDEDTAAADLILGAQVYTDAAARMLHAAHNQRVSAGGWQRRVLAHDPWRPRPQSVPAISRAFKPGISDSARIVARPTSAAMVSCNAQLVGEDSLTLAAIEAALVVPAVQEMLETEIALAVAALGTPQLDGRLPLKYSKEFSLPPSMVDIFPTDVGTIRVFGLQAGAAMSVYERHPNSVQRTRVVVGEGTWHVRRQDGTWYHDTITAAPLDAIATATTTDAMHDGLRHHTHVVPADVVHFVENQRSSGDDIHVNLTWHSATEVEDVIVSWDEESEAEGIDTYHIDSGFYKPRQGARL